MEAVNGWGKLHPLPVWPDGLVPNLHYTANGGPGEESGALGATLFIEHYHPNS